jgi:DNA-binding MarR family transcriptional regulator
MATREADAERHFLEQFALLVQLWGAPRGTGLIVARLLTCEPAYQSLGQLGEATGLSKASVSATVRRLGHRGVVERYPVPGQRRHHCRLTDSWARGLWARRAGFATGRQIAEDALPRLRATGGRCERLVDFIELTAFLEREFDSGLLDRWDRYRAAVPRSDN